MKNKPFDLNRALNGSQIVTADGHSAIILRIDDHKIYPIKGLVTINNTTMLMSWTIDGRYFEGMTDRNDLRMKGHRNFWQRFIDYLKEKP